MQHLDGRHADSRVNARRWQKTAPAQMQACRKKNKHCDFQKAPLWGLTWEWWWWLWVNDYLRLDLLYSEHNGAEFSYITLFLIRIYCTLRRNGRCIFCLHLHHSVHIFVFCILHFLIVCDVLLSLLVTLMCFWKKMINTITFSSILTRDIT